MQNLLHSQYHIIPICLSATVWMLQNHHSPAKAPPDSSGSACSLCPSSDQKRYSSWVTDNCFYSAESCETHPLEIWMCINNIYIYIVCIYLYCMIYVIICIYYVNILNILYVCKTRKLGKLYTYIYIYKYRYIILSVYTHSCTHHMLEP